ncbi:hypothetical protein QE152_g38368 [Popillia japonica]|uniref:Endonuclease-reverse transcriptase n=1 Tax=Popillia japonica TaxID=7064 RepID=A0AAW1HX27_POPJA
MWTKGLNESDRNSYIRCTEIIKDANNSSIAKENGRKATTPYWWNKDISDKQEECTHSRRLTCMTKNQNISMEEKQRTMNLYKEQKKELRKLIRISKLKHWKELCREMDEDIWGSGYRIAVRRLNNNKPYNMSVSTKKDVIRVVFPEGKSRKTTQSTHLEWMGYPLKQ